MIKRMPNEPVLQSDELLSLFKVDRGGILGLETIEKNGVYKTSLRVTQDFTVIYKISLTFLKDSSSSIIEFLTPMHNEQMQLIRDCIHKEKEKLKIKGSRNFLLSRNRTAITIFNKNSESLSATHYRGCTSSRDSTGSLTRKSHNTDVNMKKTISRFRPLSTGRKTELNTERQMSTINNNIKTIRYEKPKIFVKEEPRYKKKFFKKIDNKQNNKFRKPNHLSKSPRLIRIRELTRHFSTGKKRSGSKNSFNLYDSGNFNLPLVGTL